MRRVTIGALILITFLGIIVVGNIAASDLDALWMSLTPEGPAQADFPSGTETVYAVFEYTGFIEENVRVVVSNYSGAIIFDETQQFSGTGTASIPVTYGQGVFPDGLYVTTLYFAGQYLTQAVEWTVGGVELPTTPTPFPPAQLEVEPRTLTFSVEQGGSNPPAQRVRVSNSTAAASVWQATTRVPWISLVPEGGETPALLRVGVDATGLPAGTYTAQVIVSADDIADSPQTVDISLTIVAPADTTTLDVPAVPDGTGWVVSDEPLDNHFDDAEIQAGLQAGLDYIGGLQFDLSTIPDGSDIRAVAVILPELRWETQPPDGGWVLELVDGDLAEGWANLGYTDVADAVSRVRFVHVQNVDNLGPDGESIWYLDGAGLSVLESVTDVSNFAVMRLRYEPAPPSDPGADIAEGLFVWDEAGTLRVNFEPGESPMATETPVDVTETPVPMPSATATATPAAASPTVTATPSVELPTPTPTPIMPPLPPGGKRPIGMTITDLPWTLAFLGVLVVGVRQLSRTVSTSRQEHE